jgi:cell division protein FtsA
VARNILAIDIGSTKVAAIIAKKNHNGEVEIIGNARVGSQGMKKGVITNIDLASKSIKEAYQQAGRVAGTTPKKAIVSISGAYIKSVNSTGVVNLPNKEITIDEIDRALKSALYNANISHEYEVIHILPFKFKVDDQDFIEDPLDMTASRLEAEVHIVTAQKSSIYNLKKAVRQAGIEIENIVLGGYASAIATMSKDDKSLGVSVIDMGGSTCDLVIHSGNSIVYDDFLGVGSMHITNDLSMILHTPLGTAEYIKIHYGDLIKDLQEYEEYIEIPRIGDEENVHQVSLEVVHNIILARVEETLMILAKSIDESGYKDQIAGGIILTGGMTKLGGIRELAAEIFDDLPVRIGKPRALQGFFEGLDDPVFSTAIGLVLYGSGESTIYEIDSNGRLRALVAKDEPQQEEMEEEQIVPNGREKELELLEAIGQIDVFEEQKRWENPFSKIVHFFTKIF